VLTEAYVSLRHALLRAIDTMEIWFGSIFHSLSSCFDLRSDMLGYSQSIKHAREIEAGIGADLFRNYRGLGKWDHIF
jgi:hypothetical protein